MFKAKLIEDREYYSRRKIKVIFYFLPAIPAAFIINYYGFSIWVTILAIVTYVTIIVIGLRNQNRLTALSKEREMELDDSALRVKSKGKLPSIDIQLNTIDKITIPKGYGMPEESMKDIANEMSGNAKKNFVIISSSNQTQRFDFIIESYYMLKQFESTIESWVKKGYTIERI